MSSAEDHKCHEGLPVLNLGGAAVTLAITTATTATVLQNDEGSLRQSDIGVMRCE